MARRVAEQELRANEGIPIVKLGAISHVSAPKEITIHRTHGGVFSLQWNYTGTLLAVGFGSGGVSVYDNNGAIVKELRPCRQGGFAVMCLRFNPRDDGILYCGTAEGHIYIFKIETGEMVTKIEEHGNEINTIDFSVDGYNFVTGGKDLNVRVYETKSNKLVRTYMGYDKNAFQASDKNQVSNTQRVFSIKFHPNNQFVFLSGGWDNHIKIWDVRDNDGIKRNIRGPHIAGDSLDMKDNTILAGQWAALHALQQFDYTSGKVVKEVNFPHSDGAFIYTASYVNDNTVVAGGSGTNSCELIELSTDRHIGSYKSEAPIHSADSADDGRVVACGGASTKFAILHCTDKSDNPYDIKQSHSFTLQNRGPF